jgi:hypothetical protein
MLGLDCFPTTAFSADWQPACATGRRRLHNGWQSVGCLQPLVLYMHGGWAALSGHGLLYS